MQEGPCGREAGFQEVGSLGVLREAAAVWRGRVMVAGRGHRATCSWEHCREPPFCTCGLRSLPLPTSGSWEPGAGPLQPPNPALLWAQLNTQLLWEAPLGQLAVWLVASSCVPRHVWLHQAPMGGLWPAGNTVPGPFWFRLQIQACGSWPWHGADVHVGTVARAGPPAMSGTCPSEAAKLAPESRAGEAQVPEMVKGSVWALSMSRPLP